MCILIACPPGETPNLTDLWDATDQNPDGHGWAIRVNGTIERYRGLDPDRAIATFLEARDRWTDSWAIWHSRFATHGTLDMGNVQPFIVPTHGWVMAHNGMLPLSDGPFDDRRSDSRILAEDHLSRVDWKHLRSGAEQLDKWLSPSKVVVMSPQKEKGGPVIIFGEKRGTWSKDGCWWSARPYIAPVAWKKSALPVVRSMDADAWGDDDEAYLLPRCDACGETYGDCDCPDPRWSHEDDDAYQMVLRQMAEDDR